MKLIPRLARSIRRRFYRTEQELAKKRWRADDAGKNIRYDFPLNPASVVFDLGGYEGEWADGIFNRYDCRIEIFEPVASFAEKIAERFSGKPKLTVHTCGLGANTRSERISLSTDSSSIFIKPDGKSEDIRLVDVKEWFETQCIERVDLMKVNIEGGEFELLERLLETGLISRITTLHVQFHDIVPESKRRMDAIRKKMELTHDVLFHYEFVWDGWRLK